MVLDLRLTRLVVVRQSIFFVSIRNTLSDFIVLTMCFVGRINSLL